LPILYKLDIKKLFIIFKEKNYNKQSAVIVLDFNKQSAVIVLGYNKRSAVIVLDFNKNVGGSIEACLVVGCIYMHIPVPNTSRIIRTMFNN